jgi:hypothetical protein
MQFLLERRSMGRNSVVSVSKVLLGGSQNKRNALLGCRLAAIYAIYAHLKASYGDQNKLCLGGICAFTGLPLDSVYRVKLCIQSKPRIYSVLTLYYRVLC